MTRVLRALRFAPVLLYAFSGCTCNGGPGAVPPPTATRPPAVATPTSAPVATDTQAVAPTAPPPAAAATAPAAAVSERQAICKRYVAALSGRPEEAALLDKPEVQALVSAAADLVMCGAIQSDSDKLCTRLMKEEHGPGMACRQTEATFHALRAYPNTHAFMFTQLDWEECHKFEPSGKACDTVRDALQANDASKCAPLGDRQFLCRAYVQLDPALCQVPPEVQRQWQEKMKNSSPEVYEKQKGEPPLAEECKKAIESKKFLAQGLKGLAESGPPRERAFAKAALGQSDACAPFAESVMEICLHGGPPAAGGAPPPPGGAPPPPGGAPPPAGGAPPPAAAP